MPHWNYRIMKKTNGEKGYEYGIYEVFYDEQGKVISYTQESMVPLCASPAALAEELELMQRAFKEPVLEHQ